ncbi:hypothetical protein [Paenibacillus campi]|uniref:hypothetical protein n=1 Tax=Paenibacillus campi TaxID=3106031 RepID=UPI002AFF16EB|nr:hypothetical protein [Paenibacillus sp. SGZ-1014]
MARIILPYKTENRLTDLLYLEQSRRVAQSQGKSKPTLGMLEKEVASHCRITADNVRLIRRNRTQPSLPVAMKIAEYINVPVEEIFHFIENPDYKG